MPTAASHPKHKHGIGGSSHSGAGFRLPTPLSSIMTFVTAPLPCRLSAQQASAWAVRISASGLLLLMALVVAMQAFFPFESLTITPHTRTTGMTDMAGSQSAWHSMSLPVPASKAAGSTSQSSQAQGSSTLTLSDAANAANAGTRHLTSASPLTTHEPPLMLQSAPDEQALVQGGRQGGSEGELETTAANAAERDEAMQGSGRSGGGEMMSGGADGQTEREMEGEKQSLISKDIKEREKSSSRRERSSTASAHSAPRKAGHSPPSSPSPSPSPSPSLSADAPLASGASATVLHDAGTLGSGSAGDAGESGSGREGESEWRAEAEALMDAAQSFHLEPHVTDWDVQRASFLSSRPGANTTGSGQPKLMMVSGSNSEPCGGDGDFLLLLFLKNKLDYARTHDLPFYHAMGAVDPRFTGFWVKVALLHSVMLKHPEVEWLWWIDADAMITDMAYYHPVENFPDKVLLVFGEPDRVYGNNSWLDLNFGSFFIRNCQASLDFLDELASFARSKEDRAKWGKVVSKVLWDRGPWDICDQSALTYMLVAGRQHDRWQQLVQMDIKHTFHGFWKLFVDRFEWIQGRWWNGLGDWNWPFVVHFVGCKPCGGKYASYDRDTCIQGMKRAYTFADDQVLKVYGFKHANLNDSTIIRNDQGTDEEAT